MEDHTEVRLDVREIVSGRQIRPLPTRSIRASVHTVGCSGLHTIAIRGFRLSSGEGAHVAGFDLGPDPDEHFLGAIGASVAQAVMQLACERGLPIARLDAEISAQISTGREPANLIGLTGSVQIESADARGQSAISTSEIVARSTILRAISIPLDLEVNIVPPDPDQPLADDWQI
jgi:uncharacterized OsmC-like protein